MTLKYQECANGVAYTHPATNDASPMTIIFPFGLEPQLYWFGKGIRIDNPERFGKWDTPRQRRAFVRKFYASAH